MPSSDLILGNQCNVRIYFENESLPDLKTTIQVKASQTSIVTTTIDEPQESSDDDHIPDDIIIPTTGISFSDKQLERGESSQLDTFPVNAVMTRSQRIKTPNPPKLDIISSLGGVVSVEDLKTLQNEDKSLTKIRHNLDSGGTDPSAKYANYFLKSGLMYKRYVRPRGFQEEESNLLIVPESLRDQVLVTAHSSILGAHMGYTKTLEKVQSCFYWPGITTDIKRYCQSCHICQITCSKGAVRKAPMQISKLSDYPFQNIAIDLVGELIPASKRGHKYILTIICLATRYPYAVPLKKIDENSVWNAMESFFMNLGYPDSLLSDNGSQFTSKLFEERLRALNIKHIRSTPYHAMSNGCIERFHSSLKKCLKRLCDEKTSDWDLYIAPCLMAIRETPNSSTGFSPNELVFGRTLKGSLQILKHLMTNESLHPDTKTTYQHVLDLRSRIQETCEMAKHELSKQQLTNKVYFDKRAKHRAFKVDDQVLLLLPIHDNKLDLAWRGPYKVTKCVAPYDYQIDMGNGKFKVYHTNMLKQYYKQEPIQSTSPREIAAAMSNIATVVFEENHEEDSIIDETGLITHYNVVAKETYRDVILNPGLSKVQRNELEKLIFEFADIFSDVPKITNLISHRIILNSDEIIQSKPYPIPIHLRDKLRAELDSLLQAGIITPSVGPFASPLVLVLKPDKSLRVCVNYKKLNQIAQYDPEPMVLTEDIFDRLGGNKFYSSTDMCKGYYAIPLEEGSQDYTTFTCCFGLFKFLSLPFGLSTSAAVFTRMVRLLLKDAEHLDAYIDDVLCHTDDWQTHILSLKDYFSRVRKANLALKPSKCKFGFTGIDFLGHTVSEDSRSPHSKNLAKIWDAAQPKTKKEIMSLLGMTGYYQCYIPQYSDITAPLTNCLKKAMPSTIQWTDELNRSFQLLKKSLTSSPILKIPCKDKEFIVRSDASALGVAAVLLQEYDGLLHPVFYASKKFSPREANLSISEREGLAVLFAILKFRKYLIAKHFVMESDHRPLTVLKHNDSTSAKLQRWSLILQSYDFTLRVIPGTECHTADWLSRHF